MDQHEAVRHLMSDMEVMREYVSSRADHPQAEWLRQFDLAVASEDSGKLAELVSITPGRKNKTFRNAIETAKLILAVIKGDKESEEYQKAIRCAEKHAEIEKWWNTPAKPQPEPVENDHHTPWDPDWKGM